MTRAARSRSVPACAPQTTYAAATGALYAWVAGAAFAGFVGLGSIVTDVRTGFFRSSQGFMSSLMQSLGSAFLILTVALIVTTAIALPLGAVLGAGNVVLARAKGGPGKVVVGTSGALVGLLGGLLPQWLFPSEPWGWLHAASACAAGVSFAAHQQRLRRRSTRWTERTL